jgi:hypothetical protein
MARTFTGHIDENDCMGDSLGPKLGGGRGTINQNFYNLDESVQQLSAYDTTLKGALTVSGNSLTVTNNLTASGNVFTPNRTTFMAGISGVVAASTLFAGNGTIGNWNSIPINVNNRFNTTNGIFTAPVKGIYWFSISISYRPTTANHFGDISLFKNGVNLFGTGGPIVLRPAINTWGNGSFSMPVSLNANDTITVRVTNYSGNSGNIYALFCGYFLG